MTKEQIRPYRPDDLETVRQISFETADHGQSMKAHFDDLKFIVLNIFC